MSTLLRREEATSGYLELSKLRQMVIRHSHALDFTRAAIFAPPALSPRHSLGGMVLPVVRIALQVRIRFVQLGAADATWFHGQRIESVCVGHLNVAGLDF